MIECRAIACVRVEQLVAAVPAGVGEGVRMSPSATACEEDVHVAEP